MNYRWMSAGTETVNTEERFKLEDMNLMTFENNSSSLDHENFLFTTEPRAILPTRVSCLTHLKISKACTW